MKTGFLSFKAPGIVVFIIAVAILIDGCKKENPGPNQVVMQNIAFNPSSITVSKNATVTWTNNDNMTHNVTSDSGVFVSGNIAPGGTYSYQFTATGTYPYRCTIHLGMNGVVIVH